MKRLLILAAAAAALMTSACITVIDGDLDDDMAWHGENAQPFDASREACRASSGRNHHSESFRDCMASKGWTRS